MDREEWLKEQNHPVDYKMTYEDRGDYNEWIMERFKKTPFEANLIAQARRDRQTPSKIKKAVRSRWNLEKQRRAGSSQVWELLSYSGDVTPEILNEALEPKPDNTAHEEVDAKREAELTRKSRELKGHLRYGKMLQRRVERYPGLVNELEEWQYGILQEATNGTLKRKVNTAVMQAGRGRLRGDNDDDFIDIGTNQDRGVVHHILDGKRPRLDISRIEFE